MVTGFPARPSANPAGISAALVPAPADFPYVDNEIFGQLGLGTGVHAIAHGAGISRCAASARPRPFLGDDERRALAERGLSLGAPQDALAADRFLLYAALSRPRERLHRWRDNHLRHTVEDSLGNRIGRCQLA